MPKFRTPDRSPGKVVCVLVTLVAGAGCARGEVHSGGSNQQDGAGASSEAGRATESNAPSRECVWPCDESFWRSATPESVRDRLEAGADLGTLDAVSRSTALHLAAAWNDDPDVAEVLIDAGADLQAENARGRIPVNLAARRNTNAEVATALLETVADVDERIKLAESLLHLAARENANPAVIGALLDAGADIDTREHGESLLHAAAQNPNPAVVALLIQARAAVDDKGGWGSRTPLHVAAQRNENAEVVGLLLAAGAAVDAATSGGGLFLPDGTTPLHRAARWNGKPEVTRLLVESGADVDVR